MGDAKRFPSSAATVPGRGTLLVLAALTLGGTLLAGCTTSDPAPHSASSGGIRPGADIPTAVPNTPALRANVQITSCTKSGNGWKAQGTAKNPSDAEVAYTITIFFTTDKATVLGTGEAKVTVAAGRSGKWDVRAALTSAAAIRCILRGVGQ